MASLALLKPSTSQYRFARLDKDHLYALAVLFRKFECFNQYNLYFGSIPVSVASYKQKRMMAFGIEP
jgi:hypothetical protein